MAEILDQAISHLMDRGLTEAAKHVDVTKKGLLVSGLLDESPQPHPSLISPAQRLRRGRYISEGVFLEQSREERIHGGPYDYESLPISKRIKTALRYAGCTSIGDVQFLLEQGHIRHLGEIGLRQLRAALGEST